MRYYIFRNIMKKAIVVLIFISILLGGIVLSILIVEQHEPESLKPSLNLSSDSGRIGLTEKAIPVPFIPESERYIPEGIK